MNVPLLDLTEQYRTLREDILAKLDEIMSGSHFILGEHVRNLEEEIAKLSQARYGIGVGNGSDAIQLALLACGIKEGDEVIVPSFTFFATAGAVARIGATPVFADIDPRTYTIDPEKIKAAITEKTRAIIPVHLYGQMADVEAISQIAKNNHIAVIEDAAQSIGAKQNGEHAGQRSLAATFSFFPSKNLGAYGDGGMVITNDENIAEKLRMLRVHGSKPKYYHHELGCNSRLDELQAGILHVKLPFLQQWNEARQKHAAIYTSLIDEKMREFVTPPFVADENDHVFHQYTVRVRRRAELQQFLQENGIGTMVYYPKPLHLQPVFSSLGYKEGDFPETEKAAEEVLSLPMYPELRIEQQEYVISKMVEFYKKEKMLTAIPITSRFKIPKKTIKRGQYVIIEKGAITGNHLEIGHYSSIGKHVRLKDNVVIGQHVTIGERVEIGRDVNIGNHVVIYDGTVIGDGSVIQDGAVIGKQPMRAANSTLKNDNSLPPTAIGARVTVGTSSILYAGAAISDDVYIADLATIRERVTIGEKTIVGRGVAVENDCVIGKNCKLETNSYITAYSNLGDEVFIAPAVVTTNDNFMARSNERFSHFLGVTVKDGGRIGANSTILPGKVIQEEGAVAAGSVVTKDVLSYEIVAGVPAKKLKDVPEEQRLERQ